MKYRPSTQSSRAQTARQPQSEQTASRTKLTGETITDSVIRELLFDARRQGDVDIAVMCSKALLRITPATTAVAVSQRARARAECAAKLNKYVDHWLEYGNRSEYAKYGRMLSVQRHDAPDRARDEAPRRRRGRKRMLKHMCCWYCNISFEFGDYITVQTRIGSVTVHRVCVSSLVSEGFIEQPSETAPDRESDGE